MFRIWKFEIPPNATFGLNRIIMPSGARILSIQKQNGTPVIYAMVATNRLEDKIYRKIILIQTGEETDNMILADYDGRFGAIYIGTFMVASDQLVFHAFDAGEEEIIDSKSIESNPDGAYPE